MPFAVYETSLYLSVLFRAPVQTTSIIAQLLPEGTGSRGFYDAYSSSSAGFPSQVETPKTSRGSDHRSNTRGVYCPPHARRGRGLHGPHPNANTSDTSTLKESPSSSLQNVMPPTFLLTWLLSLLHMLLQSRLASHSVYNRLQTHRDSPNTGAITKWLKSILSALDSHNYIRFERLTRTSEVEEIFRLLPRAAPNLPNTHFTDLSCFALKLLVEDLRANARETAWTVLGTAYREFDIHESADWFLRFLMISPDIGFADTPGGAVISAQNWLRERPASEVRKKEGVDSEGRWILSRRK